MRFVVFEGAPHEFRDLTRVLRDGNLGRQTMEFLLEDDLEELLLVAEIFVDAGFVGLGGLGDAVDPRPGDTVPGKLRRGGLEASGLLEESRNIDGLQQLSELVLSALVD
jgi:hypothetical protein